MKRKLLLTLGCLVGLATLSYGGYAWYNAITYVSTDDAYVEGTISPVSAKVAGHIVELFVQDNQVVKKGELLMRVDPRDFQAKRDQARAAVATAEANLRAARSEVPLTREGTRAQIDQARAAVQVAMVGVKSAESAVEEARLREMQADLALADLQVEYTEVRAAVDGVVSKRSVELGQVVQMGQPLLAIVPLQDVWVVANFKETQLARLRTGMKAAVEVDGYPDKSYTGTMESMSAGTGARFSLLPPENATGNWVKVVQRVPVRIHLDGKGIGNPHTLRAGMSVVVTIRVR